MLASFWQWTSSGEAAERAAAESQGRRQHFHLTCQEGNLEKEEVEEGEGGGEEEEEKQAEEKKEKGS